MGLGVNDRPVEGLGSWVVRRRFMFGVTLFSMACIAYVLGSGKQGRVNETIVEMAFACLIGVTASYVFGAAWQDISTIRSARRGRDDYYHRDDDYRRVDSPEDL